jgi:hypothetical protein
MALLKVTLSNSDIQESAAIINEVGRYEAAIFEQDNNVDGFSTAVIGNTFVTNKRIQTGADVVAAFCASGITTMGGTVPALFGIVGQGAIPTNVNQSVVAMTTVSIAARKTFVHEMGHIIGAGHEDASGSARAKKVTKSGWNARLTVMHTAADDTQAACRVLNYSNPNVILPGINKASGDSDRDNATAMKNTVCNIANFSPSVAASTALSVTLNGYTYACPCTGRTYTANRLGGYPPFTYQWHVSTDGINWGSVLGTGTSFDVYSSCILNAMKFIRVTVKDGQQKTVQQQMGLMSNGPYCGSYFKVKNNSNNVNNKDLILMPNPANGEIRVLFDVSEEGQNVIIKVQNNIGQEIISQKGIFSKGENAILINSSQLPDGIYNVSIDSGSKINTKKIVIQHK